MNDTADHTDEPPENPRRRRWRFARRIGLGLVLYVLSIGPAFWKWYEAENLGGNPFFIVFYAPLRMACSFEFVEEWLNRYIVWWVG